MKKSTRKIVSEATALAIITASIVAGYAIGYGGASLAIYVAGKITEGGDKKVVIKHFGADENED